MPELRLVTPESDYQIYVNRLGANFASISPSLPLQNMLIENTAQGSAFLGTLGALGLETTLDGSRSMLRTLDVRGTPDNLAEHADDLRKKAFEIATLSSQKRGAGPNDKAYLIEMLNDLAKRELQPDRDLADTLVKFAYFFGDLTVKEGLKVYVDHTPPWHLKEITSAMPRLTIVPQTLTAASRS